MPPILAAMLLLACATVGLWRIWRGPTSVDRMLGAEQLSTLAIAILLLLGTRLAQPALVDVALLFGLLAAVATATFVTRTWTRLHEAQRRPEEAEGD
ncbi:multiple resistance and pH regulation protein F [Halomonas sp. ML-15]|uniref:monovalent cation/H+ antiporter complex subunit F n=1 Tax=Halomonas sp. ML-15 TaxID=2773305 RepID=UPI0017464082|nr:monovalent cation/H+ antiporter complex subunit F [Halomonas sp. ML-15]MBD3896270.1 multiple resistance and pH regulation protein F [Halomonas sp. ML-15]